MCERTQKENWFTGAVYLVGILLLVSQNTSQGLRVLVVQNQVSFL
jgi:hypothetical protein